VSSEAGVVVTGAASGMGAATVALLEGLGRQVVGWDLGFDADAPGCIRVDVADADGVRRAWESTLEQCAAIDALVNAAGVWDVVPFAATDPAEWGRVIGVNLTGTYLTCAQALPHLTARGGGAIVNVASLAALRAPKTPSAAYAASKGGVLAFTRALAAEVGRDGVRCNCVSPGAIETPMLLAQLDDGRRRTYEAQAAMGRLGSPSEVAQTIAFLLSPAASFVNGANLEVAGG
jgi:NAD(P)-dependent dehydrogenase (short-subunit alcohol dehydrogenase family)